MSEQHKRLLELAAKAAGESRTKYIDNPIFGVGLIGEGPDCGIWNPLTDDGDALRLAVKLKLFPQMMVLGKFIGFDEFGLCEEFQPDPYAATRRAIVRAAAAIGEAMR